MTEYTYDMPLHIGEVSHTQPDAEEIHVDSAEDAMIPTPNSGTDVVIFISPNQQISRRPIRENVLIGERTVTILREDYRPLPQNNG